VSSTPSIQCTEDTKTEGTVPIIKNLQKSNLEMLYNSAYLEIGAVMYVPGWQGQEVT